MNLHHQMVNLFGSRSGLTFCPNCLQYKQKTKVYLFYNLYDKPSHTLKAVMCCYKLKRKSPLALKK